MGMDGCQWNQATSVFRSQMKCEVEKDYTDCSDQPNAATQIRWLFTEQMIQSISQDFDDLGGRFKGQCKINPSFSGQRIQTRTFCSITEQKTEGREPQNEQQLRAAALEATDSISREEIQHLMMSMGSRLQAHIDCKGPSSIKNNPYLKLCVQSLLCL